MRKLITGKVYPKAELSRVYTFIGARIKLENVTEFRISSSGIHKLKTDDGKKHIIAPNWVHIEIDSKSDWVS